MVTPFTWTATKSGDGKIAFAGYVPTDELRAALVAAAGTSASDQTLVGSGEPRDFAASATSAVMALASLQSGEARFDGQSWSISGQPGTEADAAVVRDSLPEAKWSIALAEPPALPEPAVVAEPAVPAETEPEAEVPAEPEVAAVPAEPVPEPPAAVEPEAPAQVAAVEPKASVPPAERNFVFSATKVIGGPVEFAGIVSGRADAALSGRHHRR